MKSEKEQKCFSYTILSSKKKYNINTNFTEKMISFKVYVTETIPFQFFDSNYTFYSLCQINHDFSSFNSISEIRDTLEILFKEKEISVHEGNENCIYLVFNYEGKSYKLPIFQQQLNQNSQIYFFSLMIKQFEEFVKKYNLFIKYFRKGIKKIQMSKPNWIKKIISSLEENNHLINNLVRSSSYDSLLLPKITEKTYETVEGLREYLEKGKIELLNELDTIYKKLPAKLNYIIKEPKPFDSELSNILSACILRNGRILSYSGAGDIIVFNLENLRIEVKKKVHPISSICVLEDGRLVSSSEETIKIWKLDKGNFEELARLTEHSGPINKVITLTSHRFASCSNDKTIKIWEADTYKMLQSLSVSGTPTSIIEEENQNRIISASSDQNGILSFFNNKPYKLEKKFEKIVCAHSNGLEVLKGDRIAIGNTVGFTLINTKTLEIFRKFEDREFGTITCFAEIDRGGFIAGNANGSIILFDFQGHQMNRFIGKPLNVNGITCMLKYGGNKVLTFGNSKLIYIYEVSRKSL